MTAVRASDEDRQRVIGVLQRHTEEGRLTLEEFSDRVGTVYAAKTLDDLRAAVVDLPAITSLKKPAPTPPPAASAHDRQLLLTFGLAIAAVVIIGIIYALLK
ncbi:hypothetical protein GCM10018962_19060 [Dactylosporangium matsuzakiense]|uniref:DUF1707 domain-containing protein n=1 Tax=Dactylosporangium matsuzakiense TaxID=53360 RepID=A0A9W6KHD8_9ACTN|nr:DUF1707 domain-containing protein [Dactylosporangium matsuzakiense]UWZ44293.1 DUF1707 domain-containing protein [Dactylosporangium matsuzakiense]GLK99558.1 hypothetical protein GCM10017581_012990 [Dactylosporangium matsuzakiense]